MQFQCAIIIILTNNKKTLKFQRFFVKPLVPKLHLVRDVSLGRKK